jgi:glycosyltransferase involved in cell wall biosynthesis
MASSDVLVHPARSEGFGLVLVEAMAAGLPIACSNVEGIPEVVEGTHAIMTDPEDVAAFRQAVCAVLCRSEEEQAQAIAVGRKRAEDFRMHKRAEGIVQLFKDVLQDA